TLVLAALLFAVGKGVGAAQRPAGRELPAGGQLHTLGDSFIDIDLLGIGAIGDGGVACVSHRIAAGNLVVEPVVEQGHIGVEARKIVVVHAELGACAGFRLKVRTADGQHLALACCTIDTFMQVVHIRGAIASAHATLERPVFGGIPYQVGARADVAAKGVVVVVAGTQGQGQVVTQPPFV